MAANAFKEILTIKDFRETRAELAVLKQRQVFQAASKQRDDEAQVLSEFREYALVHERDLYGELCRRIVRLRDIEDVQQEVVSLRSGERTREKKLEDAERALVAEQNKLESTREEHKQATRMKQKFVELVQVYSDEELKEFERKEDAEMEEVAELRRDRADWDDYQDQDEAA